MIQLSKTNYILYRDCPKNTWVKIHKPEIYFAEELSEFEKQIIETGNEVDLLARNLFPHGEYQKQFEKDGFLAITDILVKNDGGYDLYEVKATNEIDKKTHLHDLTFQYNVLKLCGLEVRSANLIHLNPEYVREGELMLKQLFVIEDITDVVKGLCEEVSEEMAQALRYVSQEEEPKGPCACVYKGRSAHCTTFHYSNPDIPEYSIHDLARIGISKKKLIELADLKYFHIHEIPDHIELSEVQKNQIKTFLHDIVIHEDELIKEELDKLVFPLYFLDYETFPSAIPRFDGFSPYNQIPFQYSLHVLHKPDAEPEHLDFIYTESNDPTRAFAEALRGHIGPTGSIIVWHKGFECSRNKEIGTRLPEFQKFFNDVENRIFDLEDIFKKQHYVHKDFKGSSSIKKILPVLVPDLSYKDLEIKEGGSAADAWNKVATGALDGKEAEKTIEHLREYCKLDTYAMYAIWKELHSMIK